MLAEQPPADIAALLSLFQHVPPVVRRRAKELFETIQEASRHGVEERVVPMPAVAEVAQAPMELDEPSEEGAPEEIAAQEKSLWPTGVLQLSLRMSA